MFSAFNLSEDELSVGANVVAPCVPVTGIGGEEVICYFAYDETGSPIKNNATAVEIIRNINNVETDPLQLHKESSTLAASEIVAKVQDTSSSRFLDKEQTIPKIVVGKIAEETQISSEKIDTVNIIYTGSLNSHKDSDSPEGNEDTSDNKISQNEDGNGEVPIEENSEVTIDCDDCEEFEEISSAKALVDASNNASQGKGRWSNKKRIGRKASNILTVDEANEVFQELLDEASTSDAILHFEDIPNTSTHDEENTFQNNTQKRKLESSDVESPDKKPCNFYLERRHMPKGIGSGKGSAIKRMMSTKRPPKARGHKKKKKSSKSKVMISGGDEVEENGEIENRTCKEILTPKWRVVPLSPFTRNTDDGTVEQVAVISEPSADKEQDSALNDNEAAEVLIQIGQMAVCSGNNALACMDCGEQCKTKRDLKRHMLLHTGERVLECSQCNYKTNRTNRMKAHIKTHTGEKNYFCSKCDFASIQKPNYDKHVYDFHNKKVSCNECNFNCIGRESLNEHKKIHLANKKYACGECDYRTNDSTALKSHLTKHTKVKPVKCPQCDQRFRDNYGLKIHSLIHSGEKPYTCFKCNYQTVSQEFLDKHLNDYHTAPTKKVSNYRIYRTCKYCGYSCKGEDTFAKHQLYHEQNGPMMKCDKCDYECKKFSTMREHLHRHKGKVLRCELCTYRFINPQMYDAHMISHAQNEIMNFKQYLNTSPSKSGKTESPGKSVKQEKILSKRKQKEEKMRAKKDEGTVMKRKRTVLKEANNDTSDEKLNHIKDLGELFSNPIEDEEVSVSNENSNVYFCGSCSFSSRTKKELNAHIPIHSFNKQFTCLECGFCCDQHLELVEHIQSHIFPKKQIKRIEFECHSCKLKFSSKNSLDNHKIEHHASQSNDPLLEHSPVNNDLIEDNEISFSQGIEYECPKCDYKHELQSKIKEHIIDFHHVKLGQSNGVSDTSQDKVIAHEDTIDTTEEHEKSKTYLITSSENIIDKSCESNEDDFIVIGNQNEEENISIVDDNDISPSSPYSHNSDPPTEYNDDEICDLNGPDEFECPMCDFKISTKEGIKNHIILVHQNISPGSNIIELPNEDEMCSPQSSPRLVNDESRCETDGYVSEPEDAFTLVLDDSEGSDDEYNDSCGAAIIKSETEQLDENFIQDTNDNDDSTSDVEFLEEIIKKNNINSLEEESSDESSSQIEIYTSQGSNDGFESSNDQSQPGSASNFSFANTDEQSSSNLKKAELKTCTDKISPNKKVKSDMKEKNILKNYIGVKTIDGDWKCIDCEKIYVNYDSLRTHKKKKCNEQMKSKIESDKKIIESKRKDYINTLKKAAQKDYLLEENITWAKNDNKIYTCLECNNEHKSYRSLVYHLINCKNPDLLSKEQFKLIHAYPTNDGQFKCSNCECLFKNSKSIVPHKERCLLRCRCAPIPIDKRNTNMRPPETKDGKWKCYNCNCLFLNCRSIKAHKRTCMVSCLCVGSVDRQKYDCPYCNCSYLRESTLLYKHIKNKECMRTCHCTKSTTDKHILKYLQSYDKCVENNDIEKDDCSNTNDRKDTNKTKEIPEDNASENMNEVNFEDSVNSASNMHYDTIRVENENIEELENQEINEVSATNINHMEKLSREDENDNLQEDSKTSIISGKDPKKYPFECKLCTQRFNRKGSLTLHMKAHVSNGKFKCEICKACFRTNKSLEKHTLRCRKNNYKCEKCPFRCKDKVTLTKHSAKHVKEHPCPNCSKTFKTAKMLEFHMDLHNPEKMFECNLCNYKCKRPEYLKNHMSSKHIQKKKFACNQCEYSCHYACNLRKHEMIHDPSQQVEYECPRCDYKNKLKNRIKEHIMKVHEGIQIEKRHQCPLCPFKGRDPYVLRKHILVHTGEKPYECGECDFKCSTKVQLRRHIRIHTGETFNCTLCDFQTVDKASLQTHYITHTGVKRYVCDECDYKCNTIHRLKLHKQTHSKEKLFQCGECFKRLKDRASLMRHLTSKHIE